MLQMKSEPDAINDTLYVSRLQSQMRHCYRTHSSRVIEKQNMSNQSKSALPSNDHHALCEQLCSKLNLSDPDQITEIMRILASNAPSILKESPPTDVLSTNKGF